MLCVATRLMGRRRDAWSEDRRHYPLMTSCWSSDLRARSAYLREEILLWNLEAFRISLLPFKAERKLIIVYQSILMLEMQEMDKKSNSRKQQILQYECKKTLIWSTVMLQILCLSNPPEPWTLRAWGQHWLWLIKSHLLNSCGIDCSFYLEGYWLKIHDYGRNSTGRPRWNRWTVLTLPSMESP